MAEQVAQVIVGDGQGVSPSEGSKAAEGAPAKKTTQARTAPKWESDARDRVRAAVRRYAKPLNDLMARDANEGDTRLLITDFLCEGLGYDKYEDLTTEYQVKGEFADYGIRIDKQLVAFIEVKRCSQKLNPKHLRQVQMYAVNEGVEWMILSNGQVWQVYHMTAGLPVVIDLALEVDLLSDATLAAKTDALFHLTKEAFKRRLIDDLWKARAATSPKSLAQVLLSEGVVDAVRRELRRQTSYNADPTEIHRILREEVLRSEALS
ncbi:type I restriction enzyme HsdR N-terminal domain-containing protein [Nonomuraea rhodomycinica]|uniref:Type I restriction enzyme HsdR N-terminal domain-containing protein n=1 Tax=Nonomuraea rhodomycinica TaxID=1712872 RepID=A0A7Y6MFT8_9ACTN|nr:type I restriction enzyme HsdR N-terminal domain-containing protein [Nonomuraea rhodomycinica]NUW46292.1 type I restriction enzyme HsdR N-terminal domain-containing protein [Nonomuraea rhodomycinica]